ncbi:MAG: hypothetical protein NXI18_22030 [Alphaproteobacteria bacterium]|nr:hypothetical protein [Alphaproteobacteria bacterium]
MDLSFGRARQCAGLAAGMLSFTRSDDPDPEIVAYLNDPADGVITHGRNAFRVNLAFSEHPPNRLEAKAIRALIDNPGSTSIELSKICGWVPSGWRTHMLVACHRRQGELWPEGLPSNVPAGFALTALVSYEPTSLRFWLRADVTAVVEHRV